MSEDPTSWYCWWAPIKDLQLRELWRSMTPQNLTPSQKKRGLGIFGLIFLVEVILGICISFLLNRTLGH